MFGRISRTFSAGYQRVVSWLRSLRRRHGWFDHLARALGRFQEVRASRLAAALTFTAFLALFPLLLLAFSVLGYVLNVSPSVMERVTEYLDETIPTLDAEQIADSRISAGVIGVIGVLLTGLGWISAIRGAVRAVWQREDESENVVVAKLVDVGVMIGLGVFLGLSMLASFALTDAVQWILRELGFGGDALTGIVQVVSSLIAVTFNTALFMALLAGVSRFRMSFDRLFWPSLLGGIGLEIVKLFAGLIFKATLDNPAYAFVATAVGLLLFFNIVNRMLLFCAALTATSAQGPVYEQPPPMTLWGFRSSSRGTLRDRGTDSQPSHQSP